MVEEDYRGYLAAKILTDDRPVTYRLLSRALKINVNTAKHMLYEFHAKQNAKKPKSVHATYLLTGKKHGFEHTNGANEGGGNDTTMRSSPFMSSMPAPEADAEDHVPKTSIIIVREEELEKTKSDFEEITSIHIYSLEPGPIENMNILTTCNQEIAKDSSGEDPMERWRVYGLIHNPYIKRRAGGKPIPPAAAAASRPEPTLVLKPTAAQSKRKGEGPAPRRNAPEDNTSGKSTPQPASSVSTLKRSDSKSNVKKDKVAGDIFKSFAKAKAKPKEAAKSEESTPAPAEDEQMQGMSEDEGDPDDAPEVKFDEEKAAAARKARAEREEQLRKMMEDDDEDMPDAPPEEERESQDAPIDQVDEIKPAESEGTVTVSGGRRRGRRKVMKKVKKKDADGYLVTIEEPAWESFSEDEPQPKKLKPATKPASTTKGKKAGPKGQGNIASFFKKA